MAFERRYGLLENLVLLHESAMGLKLPDDNQLKTNVSAVSVSSLNESLELREEEYSSFLNPTVVEYQRNSIWSEREEISDYSSNTEEIGDDGKQIDPSSIIDQLQRGIGISLKKLPMHPQRDLLMTDFRVMEVINFQRRGPNKAETNFDLIVYAPNAFRFFRDLFGITTGDFYRAICELPLCPSKYRGRSKSKFYTSFDDRFILKTISKKETDFLINLFPGYFLNLTQHPKTLLPKYFGLFCYRKGPRHLRFLILNNILPINIEIHEKYDIKGATYPKRKFTGELSKDTCEVWPGTSHTLKDLDFLQRHPDGFYLRDKLYKKLFKSIERDCKVLESYHIMDYSLLLGVNIPGASELSSEISRDTKDSGNSQPLAIHSKIEKDLIGPFEARTMTGNKVYLYLGLIDILQSYQWRKKIEYLLKSVRYSSSTISVNRPDFYSERFQSFLKNYVFKRIPELIPFSKSECCFLQMTDEEDKA